jgi:molybdopterin-guanine dinucleotide biosynthesis protein
LPSVTRHHDNFGGEASAFDVQLETVTLRVADGCSAGAAAAFSPAPADLVLIIGRKLTHEIEIVAITRTAKLEIDFARRAARTVVGVATDAFGGSIFRPQRPRSGPAAREVGKWARLSPGRR